MKNLRYLIGRIYYDFIRFVDNSVGAFLGHCIHVPCLRYLEACTAMRHFAETKRQKSSHDSDVILSATVPLATF